MSKKTKKSKQSKTKKPLIDPVTGAPNYKKIGGVPVLASDGYLGDGMQWVMQQRLSEEDYALFEKWLSRLRAEIRKKDPEWSPPRLSFGISYQAKGDGNRSGMTRPKSGWLSQSD